MQELYSRAGGPSVHPWHLPFVCQVTSKRKAFDRGRIAFTFALGTQRLYDWLDRNRAIASYQADYTNHPQVIARLDNMVSITNAIEVDLYGQVAAESLGPRQISGNGECWISSTEPSIPGEASRSSACRR